MSPTPIRSGGVTTYRPIGALAEAFQTRRGRGGNATVAARQAMPAPIARAWRRSERRRAFAARRASPQRDRAPSVMAATFARRFRPGDEIVDMVEDIACVAAEGGAFAAPSHPLEHARGQDRKSTRLNSVTNAQLVCRL